MLTPSKCKVFVEFVKRKLDSGEYDGLKCLSTKQYKSPVSDTSSTLNALDDLQIFMFKQLDELLNRDINTRAVFIDKHQNGCVMQLVQVVNTALKQNGNRRHLSGSRRSTLHG
eukprot:9960099-Ditylum_brightwellii.AAC.1